MAEEGFALAEDHQAHVVEADRAVDALMVRQVCDGGRLAAPAVFGAATLREASLGGVSHRHLNEHEGLVVRRHHVDRACRALPARLDDLVAAALEEELRRLDRAFLQIFHFDLLRRSAEPLSPRLVTRFPPTAPAGARGISETPEGPRVFAHGPIAPWREKFSRPLRPQGPAARMEGRGREGQRREKVGGSKGSGRASEQARPEGPPAGADGPGVARRSCHGALCRRSPRARSCWSSRRSRRRGRSGRRRAGRDT